MYSCAIAFDAMLSGTSPSTSIELAARTVPSTFAPPTRRKSGVAAPCVGFRRDQFCHLSGDRRIRTQESFVRDDLDPGFLRQPHDYHRPVVAIRIVETDEAKRRYPILDHVTDQRVGNELVVLRGLEHP